MELKPYGFSFQVFCNGLEKLRGLMAGICGLRCPAKLAAIGIIMTFTSIALFLAAPVLQVWLAFLLVRRRVRRPFRFFFIYTIFAILAEILKVVLRLNLGPWAYFYVAWSTEVIYVVLGFAAIFEVFRLVFKGFESHWWFNFLLPGMGVVMLVPSLWWVLAGPIRQVDPMTVALLSAEIVVRVLQVGIFLLIFGLAAFFDLLWRRYEFGIAAGFFVSATGLLLGIVVRSESGIKHTLLLNYGPTVSYIIAVLIWLVSFWGPERDLFAGKDHLFTPELFIVRLESYKRKFKDLLKLWPSIFSSSLHTLTGAHRDRQKITIHK